MASTANSVDPAKIDPLRYLETYIEDFTSRSKCLEYYHVLQQALLRPQGEDVVAFDLAVKEIGEKLGIKAKVVKMICPGLPSRQRRRTHENSSKRSGKLGCFDWRKITKTASSGLASWPGKRNCS